MQFTATLVSLAVAFASMSAVTAAPAVESSLTKRWCGFEAQCGCTPDAATGCQLTFDKCGQQWYWPPQCQGCGTCPELCVDYGRLFWKAGPASASHVPAKEHQRTHPDHIKMAGIADFATMRFMSTNASGADVHDQFVTSAFDILSFTLIVYDYLLTLDWEVARYWGTPFSWPTFFYYLNRYLTLLGNSSILVDYVWGGQLTPAKIAAYVMSSRRRWVSDEIIVGIMLVLRTYALYERSIRALAAMLIFAAAVLAIAIWATIVAPDTNQAALQLFSGCNFGTPHIAGVYLAIAWSCVTAFDALIFGMTVARVLTRPEHSRRPGADLFSVMLRDGAVYFAFMTLMNVANVLVLILGSDFGRETVTTLTNAISSLAITRLMLSLRDPAREHMSGRLSSSQGETGESLESPAMELDSLAPGLTDQLAWERSMTRSAPV
ncbi:unnamed protein product [Mycena citricolor]|uniref:DUF6533 domain-containing protein n=1 Tax=Mycena citricolor TaxID=2018698 RepID=A0AAD2I1I6_9AGAR|nr:unnamed protein product [Mycena citricolor]